MREFKIRASAIGLIMGKTGLTDKQQSRLKELSLRDSGEGRPLTKNMKEELSTLIEKRDNPNLPETCTSYLKKWYSDEKYGAVETQSKYTAKGHLCEDDAISVMEDYFETYMYKNEESYENEWCTGTPDVVAGIIYDAKNSWDGYTFLESAMGPDKPLYIWQMRGYMWMTDIDSAKVCYCLLDTPEDANYGEAISFSHVPIEERFYFFSVERDKEIEEEIKERVEQCRKWLKNYDKEVKRILGEWS